MLDATTMFQKVAQKTPKQMQQNVHARGQNDEKSGEAHGGVSGAARGEEHAACLAKAHRTSISSVGFWSGPSVRSFLCAATLTQTALMGCSQNSTTKPTDEEIRIFAASSLREAVGDIGVTEESIHHTKTLSAFEGSQILRTQIENGAPFDVAIFADRKDLDALYAKNKVEKPELFICNDVVLVISKQAASRLRAALPATSSTEQQISLRSVLQAGGSKDGTQSIKLVLGDPASPIGRYSQQILETLQLKEAAASKVVSYENNVRQVLQKVASAEADAALVYRSDALLQKDAVEVIEIEKEASLQVQYFWALRVGMNPQERERALAWKKSASSSLMWEKLQARGFTACSARETP